MTGFQRLQLLEDEGGKIFQIQTASVFGWSLPLPLIIGCHNTVRVKRGRYGVINNCDRFLH